MNEIVELLRNDARLTAEDIAAMLDMDVKKVEKIITKLEKDGVILKYSAVVNEEKLPKKQDKVSAFIEIGISPERGKGFDAIAERIYQFPQVKSLYLLSGGYDLMAEVEGDSLQDVAFFVSDKLSTIENVKSTATHFMLKTYKSGGNILVNNTSPERLSASF